MKPTEDQIEIIDEISWVSNIYFEGTTYEEAKRFIDQNFGYLDTKVEEVACNKPIKHLKTHKEEFVFPSYPVSTEYDDYYFEENWDILPGNPDDFGHN